MDADRAELGALAAEAAEESSPRPGKRRRGIFGLLRRPEPSNEALAPAAPFAGDRQEDAAAPGPKPADSAVDVTALKGKVIDVVRTIFDPEIPVNIYDLGLIYEISVSPMGRVDVQMTLTAPGCPVADSLVGEVEHKIKTLPEVTSAHVELTWEPPWTMERLSEAAKLQLGFY